MPIPSRKVGDTYTETKCINGKKVIITYEVTQIKPVFRSKEIKREETSDKC